MPCRPQNCRTAGTFGVSMKPYDACTRKNPWPSGSIWMRSVAAHLGHLRGDDREQDHLLVQHLVVLEVMQQHDRRALGVGRHEHRGALHAHRLPTLDVREEHVDRHRAALQNRAQNRAAALPRRHQREHEQRDGERHPAAVRDLRAGSRGRTRGRSARKNARNAPALSCDQPH